MNQNEELAPAEPSKEGAEACLLFVRTDSPPCFTARTVAQRKGGMEEKKGCASLMLTAEISAVLGEGLQLLPLKSC